MRGRAPIIVDGGFCRGSDIVKGIACGASVVSIGRLYLYALAAAGDAGVYRRWSCSKPRSRSASRSSG